jgi:hypothetical protein
MIGRTIFITSILGIGGFLAYRLFSLKAFGEKSKINITIARTPDIVDLNLTTYGTLRIFLNVEILNPETATYTATHPYILLFTENGSSLGSNIPNPNQTYQIKPGTTKIENIELRIPVKTLLETIGATSVITEIIGIILDTSISIANKITAIYSKVIGALSGKTIVAKTYIKIDGVEIQDVYHLKF